MKNTAFILLFLLPLISSAETCRKPIYARAHITEFVASIPFPKILNYTKNVNINIDCSFYKKIKVGDILDAEESKSFIFIGNNPSLIPHGSIKRIKYHVLSK